MNNVITGDCREESLVEHLFGSVSEFARLVEKHGDNFTHGNIKVVYLEDLDIHQFWKSL